MYTGPTPPYIHMNHYLRNILFQDLAKFLHEVVEARPVVRIVHPAVPHDGVHLQWALLGLIHTFPLTQIVQKLLRGQAGVWTSSQSE